MRSRNCRALLFFSRCFQFLWGWDFIFIFVACCRLLLLLGFNGLLYWQLVVHIYLALVICSVPADYVSTWPVRAYPAPATAPTPYYNSRRNSQHKQKKPKTSENSQNSLVRLLRGCCAILFSSN